MPNRWRQEANTKFTGATSEYLVAAELFRLGWLPRRSPGTSAVRRDRVGPAWWTLVTQRCVSRGYKYRTITASGPTPVAKSKKKKSPVLADHRQVGKKFIPPFVAQLGPIGEVRWVNDLVPELLWVGLLNDEHGLKTGADLTLRLAKAAVRVRASETREWFAVASAYTRLDQSQRTAVRADLESSGVLEPIRIALQPLKDFYPNCPLNFLFDGATSEGDGSLERLKNVVSVMFDRWNIPTTFVQANAVYIAFVTDILKVAKGLALANFPAIEQFPQTEESQKVAASTRATVSSMYMQFKDDDSETWIASFWARGLELERCAPMEIK